jgi:hypothetical protein
MDWIKPSEIISEAEFRLAEGELRIKKQRQIVRLLERIGADTEQAQKLLSYMLDAQQGQKMQVKRLRTEQRASALPDRSAPQGQKPKAPAVRREAEEDWR